MEKPPDAEGNPTTGIPPASLIIHRYYDESSQWFGDGTARNIREYAKRLSDLILAVRRLVYKPAKGAPTTPDTFKCHLIAHSMGGLVARAFLQNSEPR
ncbi:hypothetical protein J8I87_00595 [Paraburkholderia sp. LEh10]|uniref:esterase/lipase family protein n=1 Tax=Paraburkholderia sp. LEh10 TaxID=2821353 RepID=UPI001AE3BB70|nr:hypothetical protein [Paraburkholderia sp. LEh10]MBP0588244.1 hypothetical protein [Paraburkholderia sp. LEh10]